MADWKFWKKKWASRKQRDENKLYNKHGILKTEWARMEETGQAQLIDPEGYAKDKARAEQRKFRHDQHKPHADIIKTRVSDDHEGFQDLLDNQFLLWSELVELVCRTGYDTHLGSRMFSLTSDFLHEHIAAWKASEAFPWLAEMSSAHIRWVVLVFSKKSHRLGRDMNQKDCPPCAKFCDGVVLSIEDDKRSATIVLPKLGRTEVVINEGSPKTWNDAHRHVIGAVVGKEIRKKGKQVRWNIKLLFGKEEDPNRNMTPLRDKGFPVKVTEIVKNRIWELKHICCMSAMHVLEKVQNEFNFKLSRATIYRILASFEEQAEVLSSP